jgi:hypothetical protein
VIDYFCKWNSEQEAKQDAERLQQYFGKPLAGDWLRHQFLENVQVWRPSQDVTNPDGSVTHTYLTGWFGILALDHNEDVILNDNSLAFALNRDGGGGVPYIVRNNIGGVLNDVAVSPIFTGSHYPLGDIS